MFYICHILLGQLQEEGKTRMQNEQNCPYLGIRSDVMMMMMMMIKGGGVYDNDDDDKGGGCIIMMMMIKTMM